jgi:hypothetical protein
MARDARYCGAPVKAAFCSPHPTGTPLYACGSFPHDLYMKPHGQ